MLTMEPLTTDARKSPGIYRHMPWEDYHRMQFCSTHTLNVISERSPLHLKNDRDFPSPTTPALLIGQALHTRILEPDLFIERHPLAGVCEAVKKSGKSAGDICGNPGKFCVGGAWLCGTHAPAVAEEQPGTLSPTQIDQIVSMEKAIWEHDAANAVLSEAGESELSVVWDQTIATNAGPYALRCKMRADAIRPDWRVCVDIKTTDDASPAGFSRSISKYGYHRQAAHYLNGCAAAGYDIEKFVFIAIEKEPPYAVGVYRLGPDSIELGNQELATLMRIYAQCEQSGVWPGYSQGFQEISLPSWKLAQLA